VNTTRPSGLDANKVSWFVSQDPRHRFVDWAAEEGQLFLREYDRCVLEMGQNLEDLVFGRGATDAEFAAN